MSTIPKLQLILGYKEFFNNDPPHDRISLLKGLCKRSLVAEIAGLNYRLKPHDSIFHDTSVETQAKELYYFCGGNDSLHTSFKKIAAAYTKDEHNYPLIFTRQTCLFALEEIVKSELEIVTDFSMAHPGSWRSLLSYLLSINTAITSIKESKVEDEISIESISPKMVPLNELSLNTDPIYTPFRGYKLLEFLSKHDRLGPHLENYFNNTYSIPYDKFVYELMSMNFANMHEDKTYNFYYNVNGDSKAQFDILSQTIKGTDTSKLLSLRKFPFFHCGNNAYILTDNILLVEKCYSQFINDFWFDHLKQIIDEEGKSVFSVKYYKSVIGYFFEEYVNNIIKYLFQNAKYYSVKSFSELNTVYNGNKIEIADVYVRHNSQILLAQVKATAIYDNEKYSGEIDTFYKNDRNKFFASFGVDQLVNSIKILQETIVELDPKFPQGKSYRIYPAIIFNERALQTSFMAKIFQDRFKELLAHYNNKKVHIYPLSMIHVSDLESIEDYFIINPNSIWDLLHYHVRNPVFMPPFFDSLRKRNIKPNYNKAKEFFITLIPKYVNPNIHLNSDQLV